MKHLKNTHKIGLRLFLSVLVVITWALPVKAKEAKLRWLCWTLAEEPSGSIERDMVAQFEKANPNIKIQLEPVPFPQMNVKFLSQSRARQAPKYTLESVDKLTIYSHIPQRPEISFSIIEAFHDATAGTKTPERALNEAADKINAILSK